MSLIPAAHSRQSAPGCAADRLAVRLFTAAALCASALAGCKKNTTPAAPSGPQWFEDVTARSGVNFNHAAGTNYFMGDQTGSGVALFDYDNDGRLDMYFVQNHTNSGARNQLFHQEADGRFKNVSAGSGLDIAGMGMGPIAGDVNNDGRPDVLVTEYGAVRLFVNMGNGKFREMTRDSGIDNPRWAVPASFIDYDRDGWLDVVVGNYLDYDPTQVCKDTRGQQEFCAPKSFGDTVTRLWRNTTRQAGASPTFEERTEQSGLFRKPGDALGLVCADFDGDGWPDIFCSDDGRPNRLFINKRNGTFVEEGAQRGIAFNAMGATAANMGAAFGDVDGDSMADLFVTHLSTEHHSLYKQGPRGIFSDHIAVSGLQDQAWRGTGFGTVLVDFNADGANDIASANGHIERAEPHRPVEAGLNPWWTPYAQKPQLFMNAGNGKFRDISTAQAGLCGRGLVGRSLATGDLDNDGAPDLVLCTIAGPAKVLRNTAPRENWLTLKLILPEQGNRDAIGAEVMVTAGGRKQWALLQPATSYLASHAPAIYLGLGKATTYESIEVRWPDGSKEMLQGGPAGKVLVVKKGK